VPDISYRQARLDDAGEIHALLLRLAPEIPLLVDTLEREEALYALIRYCARSGESWAACDAAGRIVGCMLVEPNQIGRHYAENEVLDLRYAGVAPEYRNAGVFTGLIEQLLARMLPVATRIGVQNRAQAVERLERLGFRRTDAAGGEQRLLWQPGTNS
jgi:N-acetylglutamate synthase-like GNAT family acetyltransferase